MKIVSTDKLLGSALDWVLATILYGDENVQIHADHQIMGLLRFPNNGIARIVPYSPSNSPEQSWQIIEKLLDEGFTIQKADFNLGYKVFRVTSDVIIHCYGPTYIIAACRALVFLKFSGEVKIPQELVPFCEL